LRNLIVERAKVTTYNPLNFSELGLSPAVMADKKLLRKKLNQINMSVDMKNWREKMMSGEDSEVLYHADSSMSNC